MSQGTIRTAGILIFDAGFVIGTVALAVILIQATVRHTVQLYREDRLPK